MALLGYLEGKTKPAILLLCSTMIFLSCAFKKHRIILGVLLFLCSTVFAQVKQEQRYNRFQYHSYKWRVFHTKAFHIYFPKGNDSLCACVTQELPEAMKRVKRNMGTTLLKTPNVVIYRSTDQLYESNIGLYESEPKTLPVFIAKGTRLVLAYDGNYTHLKEQLYEALARTIWEAQLQEGGDAAKPATGQEAIPSWFKEGAIRYFATGWTIAAEDALHISWQQNRFTNWQQSISYQPRLSGLALCYFLSDQYYPQAPMQLFGQLRKKKDLKRALRIITKKPLDSLYAQCYRFYDARFTDTTLTATDTTGQFGISIARKKGILRNVQCSNDGNYIAYTVFRNNARTVYIHNIRTASTVKTVTYLLPPWINDYSRDVYPVLQWTEDNTLLAVLPVKGKLTIQPYTPDGNMKEAYVLKGTDGVGMVKRLSDSKYLLAAYRKGQSDIVQYDGETDRYKPMTNDVYDDQYPAYKAGKEALLYFTSTRKEKEPTAEQKRTIGFKDTLKQHQGIYKLSNGVLKLVVTDSIAYVKWDKPVLLQDGKLLVTHTLYGTEHFALLSPATVQNYKTLGLYQPVQYQEQLNTIQYYRAKKDSVTIVNEPVEDWVRKNSTAVTGSPWLEDYNKRAAMRAREDSIIKASKDETPSFLDGILLPKDAKERARQIEDSISRSLAYNPKRVKPYILQLHSAYFTAKVNNDYFINRYQPYKNYQGQFKFPEVGGMAQGGFTDLFEDHQVSIAFRLPAGSEGSDFFFKYGNTAKKADWSFTYFRKVESLNADPKRDWLDDNGNRYPNNAKVKTHYGEVNVHHPLGYYLSGDLTEAVRYDRTIFLATDKYSLPYPDIKAVWSITTLSMTYNKLIPTLPFLYKGLKAKVLLDVFQPLATGNDGTATGAGIQVQYHLPIYKYITWVTRLQAGRSGGKSKLLYNVAGIDNNVTVRVDSDAHAPQTAPYAFQTLITPFRGHLQNSLLGDQYHVWNNDVYFPLFETLVPIETPLQFVNRLQLGVFADVATAKESWNPGNNKNRWLWSYGVSARTSLAGYPISVDVAWPGSFSSKPVWYLSLSTK